ncbi:MAG: AAA family ATPase, partial [Nitrospiria bacterium]
MSFKKIVKPQYPPRHWALVGYPGGGKSTFAMQMKAPLLPIDADHRISEVSALSEGDVYQLSDNPTDSVDPDSIARLLTENMPGSDVATIVVDSLTAIISPMVTQAIIDNDAGRNKNRAAAFKDKALAMRLLQDAVTRWGTDVLWIYHLHDARDEKAQQVTRATLSATERARLYRSINLELHVIQEGKRRGIKVVWARRGRSGLIIWDDTGKWAGMPEKIEQAVYGGLTQVEQDEIEKSAPVVFTTPEAAIEYGLSKGAFKAVQHAKNAHEKFVKEHPEAGPEQLALLWVEDVERRVSQNNEIEPAPSFDKLD